MSQPMKLIKEYVENTVLTEDKASKALYVEGILIQCNERNKNGRIYPLDMMLEKVDSFNKSYITKNRAMGELGHPDTPTVNLHLVSHMFVEMKQNGNEFVGKAKILEDLPMGKIAAGLLRAGATLGMSTRGLGSIVETANGTEVGDDFQLVTIDLVHEPSASRQFMNGILEGKEWMMVDGKYTEADVEETKRVLQRTSSRKLDEVAQAKFLQFINSFK